MPDSPNQSATLKTLDEKGKAPESRLATADAARSILSTLILGDQVAAVMRTRVQNMIDGAPMFTDQELEEAAQGWRSRVNWGGARNKIRDYLTAYSDLLNSPDTIFNVRITQGDPNTRTDYGQIFSEEFHDTLFEPSDEWSFLYHMELHHRQLAIHGIGPCYWQDKRDWRFRALKRRNILVTKEAPATQARLPIVFVRDWMYVDEVFKHIRKGKDAMPKDSRWNYDACVNAIRHAQKIDKDKFNFEQAQQKWKNNAWNWSYSESDAVIIAHAYVREFDGKVSHHIFTENSIADYKPGDGDNGYLYSELSAYDNMNQAIWVCFQDVGNGDFESVRGYGTEAYYFGEAQNRLNNATLDNAILGSAPMLQTDSPEHANKLTRIQVGPFHVLPAGFTFTQNNMGAAVQATLAVSQHFSELEAQTTGSFRTRATDTSGQARTATEVQAEIGETSKLSNANVSHYLNQGDLLGGETFRRITLPGILDTDAGGKQALKFKANCIARGIPAELFDQLASTAVVTMARPVGNGSYADRISRLQRIGQFVGDMPQRKRALYVRDSIAQIGGARELADKYGPDLEQQYPGIEQSLAILENNGFQGGGTQDPFSPDNDHILHLQIHLPFAAQILQGQMPPDQIASITNALYQHMQEHVMALENDPTRVQQYNEFKAQLGSMENAMKQVNRMAQQQAQISQQQQQPDPKVIKAQAEAQSQTQATQAEIERKNAMAGQEMSIKDAKTAQELEHNRLLTQQQLEHSQAKTTQELLNGAKKNKAK